MKSKFLRACSLVLVLVLLANMLPMQILAEEYRQTVPTATAEETPPLSADSTAHIVDEIEEKRTEFTKEFTLSNGLHLAAVYPDAVHYETENGWAEIDNTLTAKTDGTYANTAGVWDVRFPQRLSGTKSVVIEKDGYTLSFAMAGQLRDSGRSLSTGKMELSQMQLSNATVTPVDVDAMRESMQYEEMAPEKLYSRLSYADVYPNTDIVYDLDSNRVKESIVIDAYSSTLRGYSYTLDVGQMIPVLEDDGQITFYDEKREQVIMVMPAPYMVDAANVFSGDVQVQLAGKGSTYTLTYLVPQQWLAAEDRAWPVILDPVVTANVAATNIEDKTVCENETPSYKWSILDAGYSTSRGKIRSFLKYVSLPALTSSDVVVGAQFSLYKVENADTSSPVEVHKVTGTWNSETVTWATQPAFAADTEDYAIVQNAGRYNWIVTDIVRDWYATGNNGLMIKLSNAVENGGTKNFRQFYSSDYGVAGSKPTLAIVFRNNNGLESYWDYTSSSAGRAGTGYVNNFTGSMTWIHNDIGFDGNRMPVSINHIYNLNDAYTISDSNNSNDTAGNSFGMGVGWRTNYNQLVYQWSTNSSYYVWEDSDGTDHYFKYSSANTYKDEDGLELTLTTNGSGTQKYCITDKNGNCSYFDTNGRLTKLENNQQTKSNIQITYTTDTGKLISTIKDGAGRVYSFTYSNNLLSRISYKGKGTGEISYVAFAYTNSKLTQIADKDGNASNYTYSGNLLSTAQDIDGYRLTYTYNTVAASWQPYRVQSVAERDTANAADGGVLNFAYGHNQTTITDYNGNAEIYQFNDWGNTISIQDDEGHAAFAQYARTQSDDTAGKANQLKVSSKLQNTVVNYLKYSHYDASTTTNWSPLDSTVTTQRSTEQMYIGRAAVKMVTTTSGTVTGAANSTFTAAANSSYTFSAYVKTGAGSVYLAISDGSTTVTSDTLPADSSWTRLQVTYVNDTATNKSITPKILTNASCTTYIDCCLLEKAPTASRFNLIENGDFRYGTTTWYNEGFNEVLSSSTATPEMGNRMMSVTGDPTAQKKIYQYALIPGSAGDSYVVSGWAKGDSAPLSGNRKFGIQVTFAYTDGNYESFEESFNPDLGDDQWQYISFPVVAKKDYTLFSIKLLYNYNVNTAYFDGIQLYKEAFGSSYTYDSNGNVISVKDLQKQTTTYEYTNNNLTKEILPTGAELTYTYDNWHNVKTATTAEGLTYNFSYDAYGNNTSVSITGNGQTMTSTAAYSDDGNRLVATTDALGKVTKYGYNEITNVLDWVQYPEDTDGTEGTADTRTKYTYDNMYRMATAACTTDTGKNLSAAYTYTDDYLTVVQTPSTTYSFAYGDFGLRTGVSIGERTLATYNYTDDRNNYLESLDYGNDDSVEYTYDNKGRVTAETYEDGDTVTYKYDNDGALATVKDSATGRTTKYYYDLAGRLMKYTESGSDHSATIGYTYDTNNNLTSVSEILGESRRGTYYTYDDDNRVTRMYKGRGARTYSYDSFGRLLRTVAQYDGLTRVTDSYTFTGNSAQIASHSIVSSGYDKAFSYAYDDNGNIISITDGTATTTYLYDSANQLIRENNQAGNFTHTWQYDAGGNILSRTEYAYTTGSLEGVTPADTVTYTYGDSQWGDLLTAYDGNAITYDAIGNPLSDGAWTYTWEHGRELASMSDGSTTWSYTYDVNGMRTEKTDGTNTYRYSYVDGQLVKMNVGENEWRFAYDAQGRPLTVLLEDGSYYFYITNLQGDVIGLVDSAGAIQVEYTYDAWGNILSISGNKADTIGALNPLRYRGYVYDQETGLYYLQSRYYNPEMGRFINADAFISTGQGLLGNNMFAYCGNNPVVNFDPTGHVRKYVDATQGAVYGGSLSVGYLACIAAAASVLVNTVTCATDQISKSISHSVAEVKRAVEKSFNNHSVYYLRDENNTVQYVGRTNNVEKRKAAHKANPARTGLTMDVVASGLTLLEARALEQAGMAYHHTINTANRMNNQINSIAPKYWDAFKEVALGALNYGWNQISNEVLYWAGS